MKIGIVTVYDSANVGSYLQALAMQELVKMHGDEPYMIKSRSKLKVFCIFAEYIFAPGQKLFKGICKYAYFTVRHPKTIYRRILKFVRYKRGWKEFDKIISVKKANKMNLDAVLIGSDEIWNSNYKAFLNEHLYGIGIKAKKKIAYAISCGSMKEDNWKKYPKLLEGIKQLTYIFPRDMRTYEILNKYGLQPKSLICDPTLQYSLIQKLDNAAPIDVGQKYMLIYTYGVGVSLQKSIREYAKSKGLKTVAVSLNNRWCDEYINCTPMEFGNLVKNAECVVTSTFHGTIFSILYKKKVVVCSAVTKVKEIIELLDIKNIEITDDCSAEELDGLIEAEKGYDRVFDKISKIQKEALEIYDCYLEEV